MSILAFTSTRVWSRASEGRTLRSLSSSAVAPYRAMGGSLQCCCAGKIIPMLDGNCKSERNLFIVVLGLFSWL